MRIYIQKYQHLYPAIRQAAEAGERLPVTAARLGITRTCLSSLRGRLHVAHPGMKRPGMKHVPNGPRCGRCDLLEPHECIKGDALARNDEGGYRRGATGVHDTHGAR